MRVYSFLNGFADGDDSISAERNSDSASHKVGADGKMMVSLSADRSGMIKLKLQQTSSSNRFLGDLADRQDVDASLFVPINVKFMDTFRQDSVEGIGGFIKKTATVNRGAGATDNEWEIVVETLTILTGDQPDSVL
jgi:hypothetical protein